MLGQLALSGLLILSSIAAQAAFITVATTILEQRRDWIDRRPRHFRRAIVLGLVALWLMAAHGVAVGLWALTFFALGVFGDWDTAVYFSAVAFTTLGFGDIVPPAEWRHLAGICAANGLLVFGVSAAVLVDVLREIRTGGSSD